MPGEGGAVPSVSNVELSGLPALMERIEVESKRLGDVVWGVQDEVGLEAAYEQAATSALRAPLLAERSVALRRIAKRVVPKALVPAARRVVGAVDGVSRRVVGARSARPRSS
ncbi:MAG TPA: hypothetical protein VIJ34_03760 [Acidimicrobiales bacterium]